MLPLLLFTSALALAEDEACGGFHAVWSPLPDACLETIDTDRPHQTDTPHVIPAGHFQFESAVASVPFSPAHLVLLQNAYKVGLMNDVELELAFKLADYVPGEHRFEAFGPVSMRAKVTLVKEDGWIPEVTIVPWIFVPVSSSQALRAGPLVFWGWDLPYDFELEMNAGFFASSKATPTIAPVLASALTYKIIRQLGVFIDVYATGPDVAFGTGVLFAFAHDMQVDAGTYVGLHGDEPTATPFIGFSVRL